MRKITILKFSSPNAVGIIVSSLKDCLSMNYILKRFLIITSNFIFGTFERLNSTEMDKVLSLVNIIGGMPEKCSLVIGDKRYPEIQYTYTYCDPNLIVKNHPMIEHCSGFECWESQLTDVSRYEIVDIMNRYRQKVAKGLCTKWCDKNKRRVIYELRWDHQLEVNATNEIKKCDRSFFKSEQTLAFFPPDHTLEVHRDIVITSFKSKTGLQREMRLILVRLLSENHLKDWEEDTSQFRRGLMLDVGCAFVYRHNVNNYYTALNETVHLENIGHFACIFQSPFKSFEIPEGEPSSKLCQQVATRDTNIATEFNDQNYYPRLCKATFPIQKELLQQVSQSCQLHPEDLTNAKAKVCDRSEAYSQITWGEKYYGVILKLQDSKTLKIQAECNPVFGLPPAASDGDNVFNFYCTHKYEVFLQADPKLCTKWNCKDSQLTERAKVDIIKQLNKARQLIATGECEHCKKAVQYCNMMRLRWHWFLEWKASKIVQNCPIDERSTAVKFDDGPFPDLVFYEKITLTFDLPQNGQLAIGEIFSKLFWMNAFDDWSSDQKFRRGNAIWIGCSIVVRSNTAPVTSERKIKIENGSPTHMVCIYATYPGNFLSKPGNASNPSCCPRCPGHHTITNPCTLDTFKKISPFPYLCTSFPLVLSISCQVNYCKVGSVSQIWQTSFNGRGVYQAVDGSFTVIQYVEGVEVGVGEDDDSIPCSVLIMCFMFLLVILFFDLLLIYKYVQDRGYIEKRSPKFKPTLIPAPRAITEKKTTKMVERKLSSTTRKPTTQKPRIQVPKPKSTTTRKPTTQTPRTQVPKRKLKITSKPTTQLPTPTRTKWKPPTHEPHTRTTTLEGPTEVYRPIKTKWTPPTLEPHTRRTTVEMPTEVYKPIRTKWTPPTRESYTRTTITQGPTVVYKQKLLTSTSPPETEIPAVSSGSRPTIHFEAQKDQWVKKKLLTNPPTTTKKP